MHISVAATNCFQNRKKTGYVYFKDFRTTLNTNGCAKKKLSIETLLKIKLQKKQVKTLGKTKCTLFI